MRSLKKIAALSLIVGILSHTEVAEFVISLPDVIAHYNHHNQEHEPIGFVDFLVQHVSSENHPDPHPEHDNFPLRHNHSSACVPILMAFIPINQPAYEISVQHPEPCEQKKINYTQPFNSTEFTSSIWQPPKA